MVRRCTANPASCSRRAAYRALKSPIRPVSNSLPVVMISPCIRERSAFSRQQLVKDHETEVSPPFLKGGRWGLNRRLVIPLNPPLKKGDLKRLDSVGSIGKIFMSRHT